MYTFNGYGSYDMKGLLQLQIAGQTTSWAVRWTAVCVLNDWLTLYPNPSLTNHIESEEATSANVSIVPPMITEKPILRTIEVIEIPKVIKAMKLGQAGIGNYYGKLKRISNVIFPLGLMVFWRDQKYTKGEKAKIRLLWRCMFPY